MIHYHHLGTVQTGIVERGVRGESHMSVTLKINGRRRTVDADPETPLL